MPFHLTSCLCRPGVGPNETARRRQRPRGPHCSPTCEWVTANAPEAGGGQKRKTPPPVASPKARELLTQVRVRGGRGQAASAGGTEAASDGDSPPGRSRRSGPGWPLPPGDWALTHGPQGSSTSLGGVRSASPLGSAAGPSPACCAHALGVKAAREELKPVSHSVTGER